ncbi:MAG: hypothetical protein ACRCVW_02440, partial [Brevinema sp.]
KLAILNRINALNRAFILVENRCEFNRSGPSKISFENDLPSGRNILRMRFSKVCRIYVYGERKRKAPQNSDAFLRCDDCHSDGVVKSEKLSKVMNLIIAFLLKYRDKIPVIWEKYRDFIVFERVKIATNYCYINANADRMVKINREFKITYQGKNFKEQGFKCEYQGLEYDRFFGQFLIKLIVTKRNTELLSKIECHKVSL